MLGGGVAYILLAGPIAYEYEKTNGSSSRQVRGLGRGGGGLGRAPLFWVFLGCWVLGNLLWRDLGFPVLSSKILYMIY